jgi:CheY-like chemotaxis protein
VLIVDDEPDAAAEIAWHVHSWGYAVRASSNGHNALRIAAEQHPDVVLLNLDAPQLDWFATATQLRRDFSRSSCFIIAVTNRNNQSIAREYTTAQIDIVLQQPLDLVALETLLMLESLRLNRNFNTSCTKRFHAR